MVPLQRFLPLLRTMVDVPIPGVMERALIDTAVTFCRQSKAITAVIDIKQCDEGQVITLTKKEQDESDGWQLTLNVAEIISVKAEDRNLVRGEDYIELSMGTLIMLKAFSELKVEGFTEPDKTSTALPDLLFDGYEFGICKGAAAILQMQPNNTWTNYDLAQFNRREFVETYREAFRLAVDSRPYIPRPETKREFY